MSSEVSNWRGAQSDLSTRFLNHSISKEQYDVGRTRLDAMLGACQLAAWNDPALDGNPPGLTVLDTPLCKSIRSALHTAMTTLPEGTERTVFIQDYAASLNRKGLIKAGQVDKFVEVAELAINTLPKFEGGVPKTIPLVDYLVSNTGKVATAHVGAVVYVDNQPYEHVGSMGEAQAAATKLRTAGKNVTRIQNVDLEMAIQDTSRLQKTCATLFTSVQANLHSNPELALEQANELAAQSVQLQNSIARLKSYQS